MKFLRPLLCLFLLAIAAQILVGCATDDPDTTSSVPWNQPQSWEGPLPSTINQGR
jgi:type IV pilus biogenesis protein CpaD/CtpE